MKNVESVAKYSLDKDEFIFDVPAAERGTAYSIASFEDIINDEESDSFDYIIFIDGYRLENVTNNYDTVKDSKTAVKNILDYYKRQKRNVRLKQIFVDKDAPLEKDAILLANLVDKNSVMDNCKSVNVIGHSKGGTVAFNMPKYYVEPISFKKTNLYTVAVPFSGCIMASPKLFYPSIKSLIFKAIPNTDLAEKVYNKVVEFYESISSNSHMDNDVAKENGVFEKYADRYDINYVRNMFNLKNINAIKKLNHYQNIQTGIDDKTLLDSIIKGDFISIGLCLVDKYLIYELSDGFVEVSSQKAVEDKIEQGNTTFTSTTHNLLMQRKNTDKLCQIIEDTLLESEAREDFYRKHQL